MTADICLLLEGTYPFVRGGVSSWVHQTIQGVPDLTFSLLFLGGRRADYAAPQYELPRNVVHLETHYLEDALGAQRPRRVKESASIDDLQAFQAAMTRWHGRARDPSLEAELDRLLLTIERPGGVSHEQFLFGASGWQFIREQYESEHADSPFLDFFWTLRLLYAPLFQLARIADAAPDARVYHAVSTGYAGFLGALLEHRRQRPLVLTEHGIYTKERAIDLNQAEWLDAQRPQRSPGCEDTARAIRTLWIRYFEVLGRLTYRSADPIISLYDGNRARQIADGAAPERTRVVVNGVDVGRFQRALAARPKAPPKTIGLVGRVVPIKDVKTFVRAMAVVIAAIPDAEGLIIGGAEEEPAYAEECHALVRSVGLSDRVRFLGHQDVTAMFPKLGLLMLSSISEGQPLAVLEAFASGVPCVTTDVGACREQIEGLTPADRALGLAGRVVPFADPEALGRAGIELLGNQARWCACQQAAIQRVCTFYTQQAMLDAYRAIYQRAREN